MTEKNLTVALEAFLKTIEDQGGVADCGNGLMAPVIDAEWIDLGEAYMAGCAVLHRKCVVVERHEGSAEG